LLRTGAHLTNTQYPLRSRVAECEACSKFERRLLRPTGIPPSTDNVVPKQVPVLRSCDHTPSERPRTKARLADRGSGNRTQNPPAHLPPPDQPPSNSTPAAGLSRSSRSSRSLREKAFRRYPPSAGFPQRPAERVPNCASPAFPAPQSCPFFGHLFPLDEPVPAHPSQRWPAQSLAVLPIGRLTSPSTLAGGGPKSAPRLHEAGPATLAVPTKRRPQRLSCLLRLPLRGSAPRICALTPSFHPRTARTRALPFSPLRANPIVLATLLKNDTLSPAPPAWLDGGDPQPVAKLTAFWWSWIFSLMTFKTSLALYYSNLLRARSQH
jgi:hypothetical protein